MQKQVVQSIGTKERGFRLSGWSGMAMVVFGLLTLWFTLNGRMIENWWAAFILLPTLFFIVLAGTLYNWLDGRFNIAVSVNLGIGIIILTVAVMFFLNLDWAVWWPMMIIVPGLAVMLNRLALRGMGAAVTAVASMCVWVGGTMVLLGCTFLADQLGIIDLAARFGTFHWWGYFIFIPAVGAALNTVWLFHQRGNRITFGVLFLGLTALFVGWTAVMELYAFDWSSAPNWVGGIFVLSGAALLLNGLRR
jgi:hypothetical protein